MAKGNLTRKKQNENLKKLIIWHIAGFVFVNIFAGLSHEIAEAFPSLITHIFLPANVSLGQQVKLMVTPLIIVFVIEYFIIGRKFDNYIPIHLSITAAAPLITLGIYHGHNFLFRRQLSVQGAQVVLSVAIIIGVFMASVFMITSKKNFKKFTIPALIVLIAIVVALGIFTFNPPHIATFFDYINETYEIIYQ